MALGSDGNLYVADRMNNAIRKVTPAGATTTFLGNGSGDNNGNLSTAKLAQPFGLCFDSAGNMYIADTSNDSIRKVDLSGNATVLFADGKLSASSSPLAAPPFNILVSKVTRLTKTPGFTLTITPKTGLFKGTFTPVWDDATKLDKKLPAYQGVLLQKEFRYGAGYFHSNQKGDTASEAGEVSLQSLKSD